MEQLFKIFPSTGYKNTQFQIVSFTNNLRVYVEYNGELEKTVDFDTSKIAVIKNFENTGKYRVFCKVDDKEFSQTFEIKDAIRLGTSEFKRAFTFDQIHYSFLLMMDRMLIYNETTKQLWEENDISPTDIKQIDSNNLLFITKLGENITNYGIYSLINYAIIAELVNCYVEVKYDEENHRLWLFNPNEDKIFCFSLKVEFKNQLKEIVNFGDVVKYKLYKYDTHIYIETSNNIFIVNFKDTKSRKIEKMSSNALDEEGYYYHLKDGNLYYKNITELNSKELKYTIPQNFNAIVDRFYYYGNEFISYQSENGLNRLAEESISSQILNLDNSKNYQYILIKDLANAIEENYSHESYPTQTGIYIIEKKVVRTLKGITHKKDNQNNWKSTPNISSITYFSLTFNTELINKTLIEPVQNFKVLTHKGSFLIIQVSDTNKLIKNGQIIRETQSSFQYDIISFKEINKDYLIEKNGNVFNVYSPVNLISPLLGNINIKNLKLLQLHGVIWYSISSENRLPHPLEKLISFNLKIGGEIPYNETHNHSLLSFKIVETDFKEKYFLGSNREIINSRNCEIKDAAIGEVINVSNSLNKVITKRGDSIYLLKFNINEKKYREECIGIPIQKHIESYLSPNGQFLILQNQNNQYVLYDINSDSEIKFFSEKFLAFTKEGNLIFENDTTRAAKIIDPLTFEDVTPLNYHHFRFLSPDGELYSQLVLKTRFFDLIENKYIDAVRYNQYKIELDGPTSYPLSDAEKIRKELLQERERFYLLNKNKLNEINIKSFENLTTFSIIRIEKYTEIGIVGTTVTTEITFPGDITFFNYASFSYDNKFLGGVCRVSSSGLIKLFKLNYNKAENKLIISDEYLSRYPRMACWVCGFSNTGYFATYDSTPDTYILNVNDELFEQKTTDEDLKKYILGKDSSIYRSYRNMIEIKGKNFLCFSPSGNFLSLSEQGYEPLTLGGYGHQESSVIHIAKTINGEIVDSFLGHGDRIKVDKNKKVVFVAFSEDEKQIMSMSADGVVIVRNITLQLARSA